MNERIDRLVPARALLFRSFGGAGKDDGMHALAAVQERSAQRTGTHYVQGVPAAIGHVVGKNTVVGTTQPEEAEHECCHDDDQCKQERELNDFLPPSRVFSYSMAVLYLVATPIGNLADITARAVEVLRNAAAVACEDTRHSRKLLSHLGISRLLISCHGRNTERCFPRILGILHDGGDVAYISDAGTPGVSDPGSSLVRSVREAGFATIPVPGPSAVTALISVSGVAGRGWFFEGFLPPKGNKRRTRLADLVARGDPVVLYESPHRFARLIEDVKTVAPGYSLVIGRELTKIHEQIVSGTVEEIALMVDNSTIPLRGEFVVVVWSGKSR